MAFSKSWMNLVFLILSLSIRILWIAMLSWWSIFFYSLNNLMVQLIIFLDFLLLAWIIIFRWLFLDIDFQLTHDYQFIDLQLLYFFINLLRIFLVYCTICSGFLHLILVLDYEVYLGLLIPLIKLLNLKIESSAALWKYSWIAFPWYVYSQSSRIYRCDHHIVCP